MVSNINWFRYANSSSSSRQQITIHSFNNYVLERSEYNSFQRTATSNYLERGHRFHRKQPINETSLKFLSQQQLRRTSIRGARVREIPTLGALFPHSHTNYLQLSKAGDIIGAPQRTPSFVITDLDIPNRHISLLNYLFLLILGKVVLLLN